MRARPDRGQRQGMTRVIAIVRGLWPDHNPLRRASDRAEAGIFAGLAVAFLLGAPLIAMVVWQLALTTAFTTRDAEHAGWRPVPARLLADAPQSYGYDVAVPRPVEGTRRDRAQRVDPGPAGNPRRNHGHRVDRAVGRAGPHAHVGVPGGFPGRCHRDHDGALLGDAPALRRRRQPPPARGPPPGRLGRRVAGDGPARPAGASPGPCPACAALRAGRPVQCGGRAAAPYRPGRGQLAGWQGPAVSAHA